LIAEGRPVEVQRRRPVAQTGVDARGRAAELVDEVVLSAVVLRQPHLARAGVLVEVLVLHRVVQAGLEGALRLLLLRLARLVERLVVRPAELFPRQVEAGDRAAALPLLRDRGRAELGDELAPHLADARAGSDD